MINVESISVNTNKMVNAIIIRNEGTVMLLKNNSAKLFENRNATQNAATHPSNDNASRTNPLIKLMPADMVIITGMTKSTQTMICNNDLLTAVRLLNGVKRLFISWQLAFHPD